MDKNQINLIKKLSQYIRPEFMQLSWDNEGLLVYININKQIVKDREKVSLTTKEQNDLKYLISIGTPNEYRANLWLLCSNAKNSLRDNVNYYQKLKDLSKSVPCLCEKQINADIKRTNPKRNNDTEFLTKLKNILVCFSIRNSNIGYCQGFNFIVSRILEIVVDEVYYTIYNNIGRLFLGIY